MLSSASGAFVGGGMRWGVAFVHARLAVAMGRTFEHWPGEGEALPKPSSLDYWTWFPGMGFGDCGEVHFRTALMRSPAERVVEGARRIAKALAAL